MLFCCEIRWRFLRPLQIVDRTPHPVEIQLGLARLDWRLRSRVHRKVWEAIRQSVVLIMEGVDGSLMIEAKSGGLFGMDGTLDQSGWEEG